MQAEGPSPMKAEDRESRDAPSRRHEEIPLLWAGVAAMLVARPVFAVAAQGLVAAIHGQEGAASAWQRAGAWLPVYGTLVDLGCLALLWWLTRREGSSLFALIGFRRQRLGRDVLLGLVLIPFSLLFIFGGVAVSGLLVYGSVEGPQFGEPLPVPATLYALIVWPLLWGLTEQMTYNGYAVTRLKVLTRGTAMTVVVVAFFWALQHAFMPLTFDPAFMLHRVLGSVPHSIFAILVFLRLARLLPLVIAHWLMDGASVLLPLLR